MERNSQLGGTMTTGDVAFPGLFDAWGKQIIAGIIGLHALMGFVFIALIGLHVINNRRSLTSYLRGKVFWMALPTTSALTLLFWLQPPPIQSLLSWSGNLGPAMERFQMDENLFMFMPQARKASSYG